jgi:hypothetical protein
MIYHTRGEHTNHYTTDGVENNIDDIKSTKTIVAVGFLFALGIRIMCPSGVTGRLLFK